MLTCTSCPLARHLNNNRFACSYHNRAQHSHPATPECETAIETLVHQQPPSIDLMGLEPEIVANYIGLGLNELNSDIETPTGTEVMKVSIEDYLVAYLKQTSIGLFYSDRFPGFTVEDPFLLGLLLVHPDYLYGVPLEILTCRNEVMDYM